MDNQYVTDGELIAEAWASATAQSSTCLACGECWPTTDMVHGQQFGADNGGGWLVCMDCTGDALPVIRRGAATRRIAADPRGRGWWTITADGRDVGSIRKYADYEFTAFIARPAPDDSWMLKSSATLGEALADLRRVFLALEVIWDAPAGRYAVIPHTYAQMRRRQKAEKDKFHHLDGGVLHCPVDLHTYNMGHHRMSCVCGVHLIAGDGSGVIRRFWTHEEVKAQRAQDKVGFCRRRGLDSITLEKIGPGAKRVVAASHPHTTAVRADE